MRWVMCVVLLWVLSAESGAGEVLLIPEHNPKPIYPPALLRAGVTGDVQVRFMVYSNGSVGKLSILQSDHPDLAEASRVAVEQWRFKPWAVDGNTFIEREVIAPMRFRLDLDSPIHTNQWLKTLKCRDLNEALVGVPESAWVDSAVFGYTRAYLSNVFHITQLPNEKRLAWIANMNKHVPIIVRECRTGPTRKFKSLLPVEIRELL